MHLIDAAVFDVSYCQYNMRAIVASSIYIVFCSSTEIPILSTYDMLFNEESEY